MDENVLVLCDFYIYAKITNLQTAMLGKVEFSHIQINVKISKSCAYCSIK